MRRSRYGSIITQLETLNKMAIKVKPLKPLLHYSLSTPTRIWLLTILVVAVFRGGYSGGTTTAAASTRPTIPAVIVFGDSIVDPGNNNGLKTVVKADFPPYGRDFSGRVPTGRFSNGRIPSDFLAEAFGVKKYVPAYLDPNLKDDDLLTGVSFASGASGYDPMTPKIASVLSMSDQLDLFNKYVKKLTTIFGNETAAKVVSESIYVVCTGSNDITNTYFSTPFRKYDYDIQSYTDLMIDSASAFYQELYRFGARRIGIVSVSSIGCVPSQRTLHGGPGRDCSEPVNQAARLFNSKLSSKLKSLNQKLPAAKFVFLDIYSTLISIIQNPTRYGFEVDNRGCCGTGNIEVSILCNQLSDSKTCKDATKFVFWDSFHPTERAYQIIVNDSMNKYSSKFF